MKKILSILAAAAFCLVSCTSYDEIAMWNKNEDLGERVSRLEELCEQMNSNISALQLIVEALQDNDYVTGVVPVTENGETIGYTINFSKSGPVTIYHGKDGEKGDDGKTPVIGVKKDTDGLYYWTLDGEWLTDDEGKRIPAQGRDGKSAYELAVEKGYTGTLEQWLESLNGSDGATGSDGKSAYELAVEMGYTGTLEEWLESLKGNTGADGKSAYELAVEMGYTGTLAEWLASLNGGDGNDGKSAYELAVEKGYTGTLEQWLESLKGESGNNGNDGDDGQKGDDGITPQLKIDEDGYWCVSYDNGQTWDRLGYAIGDDGASGQTGADGKSAYELAVENGYQGTLEEWLESLKGSDGANGDSMFEDVVYNDGDAYITLILAGSGEQIKIPVYTEGFTFELKQSAVTYTVGGSDDVFVEYELNAPDPTAVAIECISHSPYKFSAAGGKITVSLPEDKTGEAEVETEVLVFASDDKTTVMRKFTINLLKINYISYTATEQLWIRSKYDYFRGADYKYLPEYDTYNPETGEGKWAYVGTPTELGFDDPEAFEPFNGNKSLKSIILPEGLEVIGSNAFARSNLAEIVLPSTLIKIDQFAFAETLIKEIVLPASVKILGSSAFDDATDLESVDLSMTKIERLEVMTFAYCSSLKDIKLPPALKSAYKVFYECSGLESIVIPDSLTELGDSFCFGCTNLKYVTFGSGLTKIGKHAFWECPNLEWIECNIDTPPQIEEEPFPVSTGGGWDEPNIVTYKIYVPDNAIDTYKNKWKTYNNPGESSGIVVTVPPTQVIYPISKMPTQ
ncbi:MAG TPA: leucine-rich repeat protein [Candidatus Cryptobacteroides pullicola]|nr:leucine-rich repeat protein [Candidatus Cryptobacteroides pullicola]